MTTQEDLLFRIRAQDQASQAFNRVGQRVDDLGRRARRSGGETRRFGGAVQQVGFQVGDFATQVASGQSAVVAFTQQGAQVAGAFGPWGAVLGAAGAVVGALAVNLFEANKQTRTLKELQDTASGAVKDFRGAAITGSEGIAALIENYGKLDRQLLRSIKFTAALNRIQAKGDIEDQIAALSSQAGRVAGAIGLGTGEPDALERQFGLSGDAARRVASSAADLRAATGFEQRAAAIESLQSALERNVDITRVQNREFVEFAIGVSEAFDTVRRFRQGLVEAEEAAELLNRPIGELVTLAEQAEGTAGGAGKAMADLVPPDLADRVKGVTFALDGLSTASDELRVSTGRASERLTGAAAEISDALSTMAGSGLSSFQSLADGMLKIGNRLRDRLLSEVFDQIALGAVRALGIGPQQSLFGALSSGVSSLIGGGAAAGAVSLSLPGGAGASGAFGGIGTGLSFTAPRSPLSVGFGGAPGFANGGLFEVGGRAGRDRNLVPLRLTRGERVEVTPAGRGGGAPVVGQVIIQTPDPESFRASRGQIEGALARAVARGRRQL